MVRVSSDKSFSPLELDCIIINTSNLTVCFQICRFIVTPYCPTKFKLRRGQISLHVCCIFDRSFYPDLARGDLLLFKIGYSHHRICPSSVVNEFTQETTYERQRVTTSFTVQPNHFPEVVKRRIATQPAVVVKASSICFL